MRRRLLRWLAAAAVSTVLLGVVLLNGCTSWLARSIIWGPNTDRFVDAAMDPPEEALARLGVDRHLRVDVGPPAASLSLWVVDPPGETADAARPAPRGTILILHGINDRKQTMLGVGKEFARRGYRSVLVDLRAHGRSSGQWLSFGAIEAKDLSQVIDALESRELLAGNVGVFGPSFGGGVAVQLAGCDERVKAAVSVCGFTSMREVTPGVYRMYAPIPVRWLMLDTSIQRAITHAGRVGGFDPDDADALLAIKRTEAQVLLIHGKEDRKIPPSHSKRLHAAAHDRSRLVLLDNEDHDSILAGDAGGVVVREAGAWFDQWLK